MSVEDWSCILSFSEISGKISNCDFFSLFPQLFLLERSIDFISHCFYIIRLIDVTYAELNYLMESYENIESSKYVHVLGTWKIIFIREIKSTFLM